MALQILVSTLLLLMVRGEDVQIIYRYDWGAKDQTGDILSMAKISDIVIGNDVHSGSLDCVDETSCKQWMKSLQERDHKSGLPDLKFNFYVSSQGVVFEGRGWNKQGGFTEKYAPSSLGVAYIGDYSGGLSVGAENAIKNLIKMGYKNNKIPTEFCMMFTCDTALQNGQPQGPSCPGGDTYTNLQNWEPLENVKPKHVYRPCGCGLLDDPTSGVVSYDNYDVYSIAKFSCSPGFELIGENKRTCEISGAWSDVSVNPPQCVDPKRGLVIVPKDVWDTVSVDKDVISPGFPIATFFVDVVDSYCVDDSDCRSKLQELKRSAAGQGEGDVLCNFYIAKTGIVYEGRGWAVRGAYNNNQNVDQTQGMCFLGEDAVTAGVAADALFMLIREAQDSKKLDFEYCLLTRCPAAGEVFCKAVEGWNMRSDRPDYSNKFCEPQPVPADNRAPALQCRHKSNAGNWLNYMGVKSVTGSGCSCLPWADQTTQHHFYPAAYPHADLTSNYCRNPDQDSEGPWCITDSDCDSGGRDSCEIPQCAPSVTFDQYTSIRYTLNRAKSTVTDKMTISFNPNTLNTRLIRIQGGLENYWEVGLVDGKVNVVMSLSHGDTLTLLNITSLQSVGLQQSSEVQILRKNHKVLLLVNGQEVKYTHPLDLTEEAFVQFFRPTEYIMGKYISENSYPFQGCMADITFNKDNILAVVTGNAVRRGTLITDPGQVDDSGCLAVVPFSWGNIDIVTTAPPKPTPVPTIPVVTEAPVKDDQDNKWAYIIIAIVLVLILLILLIGCVFFKRYNKDKGVYNVDEAKTTKWDWKKGIIPVLTEEKKKTKGEYNSVNPDESPEVFA